eukprot:6492615-Amphidinium_carterae.2
MAALHVRHPGLAPAISIAPTPMSLPQELHPHAADQPESEPVPAVLESPGPDSATLGTPGYPAHSCAEVRPSGTKPAASSAYGNPTPS